MASGALNFEAAIVEKYIREVSVTNCHAWRGSEIVTEQVLVDCPVDTRLTNRRRAFSRVYAVKFCGAYLIFLL